MEPVTLKQAVIEKYSIEESQFEEFVLKKTLFFRVRLLRPFVTFFNRQFLYNEKKLVEQVGKTCGLREVHEEIDFYQHKFVAGFLMKDVLRIRISGMKMIILAREVFDGNPS